MNELDDFFRDKYEDEESRLFGRETIEIVQIEVSQFTRRYSRFHVPFPRSFFLLSFFFPSCLHPPRGNSLCISKYKRMKFET